ARRPPGLGPGRRLLRAGLDARPDGRGPLLVRVRRPAAAVRRSPGLGEGVYPPGGPVWQGQGAVVVPRGPRLYPGPPCRGGHVAAGPPGREGTPGLPRILVTDRARRLGVPGRPVPGGGAAFRAESAGRPQAGRGGGELAVAGRVKRRRDGRCSSQPGKTTATSTTASLRSYVGVARSNARRLLLTFFRPKNKPE